MGMRIMARCCAHPAEEEQAPSAPVSVNFEIVRLQQIGRCVVAEINYPDCTNFEGTKVLVFEGVSCRDVRGWSELDPHFSLDRPAMIARFRPTAGGFELARYFARSIE